MPWVFTYSDLGPQIIESLLEHAPFCSLPASLPNFRLVFKGRSRKWGGALATLEKSRKTWVYGSALLLPPDDIRLIDKYYSAFDSQEVTIFLDATKDKVKAKTYFLKGNLPYAQPSDDYVKAVLKHLKFFWGQAESGKVTLENFGISLESPPQKRSKKAKEAENVSMDIDESSDGVEVSSNDSPKSDETEVSAKRRKRRTVKKK